MYNRRPLQVAGRPVTDIVRNRLWRQSSDSGPDGQSLLLIEKIIDNLATRASSTDPQARPEQAARVLFDYAQPAQAFTVSPEQVKEIIANASDEELAMIFGISGGEFRAREQKFLTEGEIVVEESDSAEVSSEPASED